MTEISNMVSYYNHPLMYGGGGGGGGNRGAQHQVQPSVSPVSPASSQAMSSPLQSAAAAQDAQQQCSNWYYQHHHHHHHQQHHQQHQYFADAAESSPMLWPAHAHPAYLQYQHHHAYQQQQVAAQQQQQQQIDWSSDEANNNNNNNGVGASEPSPAITVSGSEISSPGTPASPSNNNNLNVANNNNTATAQIRTSGGNRSPFEWMKKNSYQPNPGKTRTKEKYRVVYTEHQRLELEKEFYSSKYITIRRKAELATSLALSERQVKIWFQNRRAKERKQTKKRSELVQRDIKPILDAHGVAHAPPTPTTTTSAAAAVVPSPVSGMANLSLCNNMNMGGMTNLSLNSMMSSIGMPPAPSPSALMAHHHHHHHHQLLGAAVAAAAAAQQQQQQQQQHHPQHPGLVGVRTDSAHAL